MMGQSVFVALFVVFGCASSAKIPEYIHVCRRSDPQVEQCILNSIETLRPKLRTGLPELAVPPMEPLILPVVNIAGGENGLTIAGRNIKVHGASDFVINKLKLEGISDSRPVVHLDITLPRLDFDGEFDVNAEGLPLPLKGTGNIRVDATNTKADVVLHTQVIKKGNHNYLRFNKIEMGLKIDDYNVHLDKLFGGNQVLAQAVNDAVSENKKEFMRNAKPVIVKVASELILDTANKIAKNHHYDELFPQ